MMRVGEAQKGLVSRFTPRGPGIPRTSQHSLLPNTELGKNVLRSVGVKGKSVVVMTSSDQQEG
jgi:hypothetical protein